MININKALKIHKLLLIDAGLNITSTEDEKYDFVIKTASGALTIEQVKNWINHHLIK